MIHISLITWGGVKCAVVHTTNGLKPFLERISRVADTRVRNTAPISIVKDATLRERWTSTAQTCGACWALGITAVTF